MEIVLVEPFFTGSHQLWAEGLVKSSAHSFTVHSLPGRHWKWRMHGAAITLSQKVNAGVVPDLILVTDMLDVATFRGLLSPKFKEVPVVVYFHENQLTYPWSPDDQDVKLQRDTHYAFINYSSALASDYVLFNSQYHQSSFLKALPAFLKLFPDHRGFENVEEITKKSQVIPIGLDLKRFDPFIEHSKKEKPIIVWNHRWEYDKNPVLFLKGLRELKVEQIEFELVLLGEGYKKSPQEFDVIQSEFEHELIHVGFAKTFEDYAKILCKGDIMPITSNQDFFGISAVEGAYCGAIPILPKRLAFPEVFENEHGDSLFYESDDEFLAILKNQVQGFSKKKTNNHDLSRFHWGKLIHKYDAYFTNCLR